ATAMLDWAEVVERARGSIPPYSRTSVTYSENSLVLGTCSAVAEVDVDAPACSVELIFERTSLWSLRKHFSVRSRALPFAATRLARSVTVRVQRQARARQPAALVTAAARCATNKDFS